MGEKQSKPIGYPGRDLIDMDRSLGENVQHWIKPSTRLKRNMDKYPDSIRELYLQRAALYLEEGDCELAFNDTCSYLIEKGQQTLRACCIRASCLDKWGDYIGAINEWTRAYTFLVPGATIAHALEQTTFRSPTWCHVCHELLVGVKRQGLSCLHCELTVHQHCVSNDLLPCASADRKAESQHNFAIVQNSFAVSCEICQTSSLGMNNTNFAYCLKCEMKLHLSCWNEKKASFVSSCRRKKPNPAFMWKIFFGLAVSLYHNFEYESALGHYTQAIEELHALSNDLTSCNEQSNNNNNGPTSRMSGLFQSLAAEPSNESSNPLPSSATSTSAPTLLHSTRLSGLFNSISIDPSKETPTASTSYFRSFSSRINRNATNTNDPPPSVAPTTATTTPTTMLTSSLGSLRSSAKIQSCGICESLIPSLALVRANRGVLQLVLKNYDECISDISFALQHGVKSELFYRSRGNAYFELGLLEKARLDFIEMETIDATRSSDNLPGRYLEVLSSTELSSAIFSFLPQSHQSKCRLVCKFWNVSILKRSNLSVAGICQLQLKNYLRQFPEIQIVFSSFLFQYSSVEPKTTITLIYTDGIREEVEFNISHTLVNIYQYVMFREVVVYAKDHIRTSGGSRHLAEKVFTEKDVYFSPFGPFDLFIRGSHQPLRWLAHTIESEYLQDCTLVMRRKPPYELTKPQLVDYAPDISNLIPHFEFTSIDVDMEAHRLAHLKTTAFLACIARNNWLAHYQFSQGMIISESGDDLVDLETAVAMLDVGELERTNKSNGAYVFTPRASNLPHLLAMVHLREKYLLLQSLLEAFREEIAPTLSSDARALQQYMNPSPQSSRNWLPNADDVMQERFHYPNQAIPPSLSPSSSSSSLQSSSNTIDNADPNLTQPRPLPLLYFEANSMTKLLLLRYTAWMKALEACQISNAFLFDFFRQWQHKNDVYDHPILLYDLFAAGLDAGK